MPCAEQCYCTSRPLRLQAYHALPHRSGPDQRGADATIEEFCLRRANKSLTPVPNWQYMRQRQGAVSTGQAEEQCRPATGYGAPGRSQLRAFGPASGLEVAGGCSPAPLACSPPSYLAIRLAPRLALQLVKHWRRRARGRRSVSQRSAGRGQLKSGHRERLRARQRLPQFASPGMASARVSGSK